MRAIIYLSLHCRHQIDSCIKMVSDESHCNVSSVVRDVTKSQTRQCLQTTNFEDGKEIRSGFEPRSFCLPALPLGQTRGSTSSA